ncbi:Photosystem I assembly protein Ycf3 [Acaryochloris thomasi RCC1774]|uniref:Photosystem I assembly protein Ycf3 n=1 Tax=Acaryochloris thomasi RCC1774 TaxID=1764569 RepID=A0A2W1JLZ4_9CYAN|nr:tetratricopeptide repeat protein [Acaryochloris thomasi]PZD71164.1 Photosystem I assembly protein Ycf3 [Acaryochloris thomasi RCC1774]
MAVLSRIYRVLGVVAAIGVAIATHNLDWTKPSLAKSQDRTNAVEIALGQPEAINREDQSVILHSAGIQKALQGNYLDAIEDYSQALRLSPRNPDIFFNRAVAHYAVGHSQQALRDFNHVIQLQPTMAEAYADRATLRLEAGDSAGAIADVQKAADLFEQQGEPDLAAEMREWVQQHNTGSDF